jgi:hypothetical protein
MILMIVILGIGVIITAGILYFLISEVRFQKNMAQRLFTLNDQKASNRNSADNNYRRIPR